MMKRNFKVFVLSILFSSSLMSTYSQENVNEEFLAWAEDGKLEEVKNYLNKGADINYKDEDGQNAAYFALWNYDDDEGELFNFLVSKNIDLTILVEEGNLLHVAADYDAGNSFEIIHLKGVDLNLKNDDGDTPAIIAASNEDFDAVDQLVQLGCDITIINEDEKSIIEYYDFDEYEIWEKLLTYKLSQKQKDNLLIVAIDDIESTIYAEKVLNIGANPDALDEFDEPILFLATGNENMKFLSLLIAKGVNINALNEDGENALFDAYTPEILEMLLKNGIDVSLQNGYGKTALFVYMYSGWFEYVRILVENGADITSSTEFGTPLEYAKTLKDSPGLKYYAEDNAEGRKSENERYKAHIKEIVDLLISKGAK